MDPALPPGGAAVRRSAEYRARKRSSRALARWRLIVNGRAQRRSWAAIATIEPGLRGAREPQINGHDCLEGRALAAWDEPNLSGRRDYPRSCPSCALAELRYDDSGRLDVLAIRAANVREGENARPWESAADRVRATSALVWRSLGGRSLSERETAVLAVQARRGAGDES